MNGPDVDGTPVDVNGPVVDGIFVNVNNPDVNRNRTDLTPPHSDFPHYQISPLGYLDPFSGAYPLLPTPNLTRQIACDLKHLILSDGFSMTPLQGRTALPPYAPYLRVFSASFSVTWLPTKTSQSHFQHNFMADPQTFSRARFDRTTAM